MAHLKKAKQLRIEKVDLRKESTEISACKETKKVHPKHRTRPTFPSFLFVSFFISSSSLIFGLVNSLSMRKTN